MTHDDHGPRCVKNEIHTPGRLRLAVLVYEDLDTPSGLASHIEGFEYSRDRVAGLLRVLADQQERLHNAALS